MYSSRGTEPVQQRGILRFSADIEIVGLERDVGKADSYRVDIQQKDRREHAADQHLPQRRVPSH